jgi:Septum formation
MKRLLPAAVAVVVLAAIGGVVWWANRSAPIPSSPPTSAPAVGSCWDVPAAKVPATLPWPGAPVACTASHTAEIYFVGQVDRSLVKDYQSAKGQAAQAAAVVMEGEARNGCTGRAIGYLGGAWRSSQLTIVPDFLTPEKNGFYACAVAQISDPGGDAIVTRTASLAGALTGADAKALAIDCYDGSTELSFVPCTADHRGEYVGLYTVTPLGAQFNGPELQAAVTKGCQTILDGFLGLSAGSQSRDDLRSSYVGPTTSATWLGSDQSFACYAVAPDTISGSIKGLGTRSLPH